jgi:hypothetical protein
MYAVFHLAVAFSSFSFFVSSAALSGELQKWRHNVSAQLISFSFCHAYHNHQFKRLRGQRAANNERTVQTCATAHRSNGSSNERMCTTTSKGTSISGLAANVARTIMSAMCS